MYNVFIDHPVTRLNVALVSTESAYDASGVANLMDARGFRVCTDIWTDTVWDAMVSPAVYERFCLGCPELLGSDA